MAKAKKREYTEPPTNIAGYDPTRDADGMYWDSDAATKVLGFFRECLCLASGTYKKFDPSPWQCDYLATLFGWKRRDNGTRRYRESLFFVPRKNGKTETGAGITLFCLLADGESRAEIYSAAYTREQASRVYEPAEIMSQRSGAMRQYVHPVNSRKRLEYDKQHSYYVALSADSANAHGKNPHAVLFDELHTQTNRKLYDGLKSGMGARRQPLFVSMTTAGFDRHSICYEVYQYACNVRDGIIKDPTFLPMLYEIKPGDDWQDEEVWKRCNPNLGVTVSMQFLRDEFERATSSPAYENTFRNLYLNEWTEQAVRWLPMDAWDACATTLSSLDGESCWAGLDMSSTTDITAFVLAFPRDGGMAIVPHFWICEEQSKKNEKTDRVPYRQWAKEGFVSITPGNVVDYDRVRADIRTIGERYYIREIAADRWNATQLITQLQGDGFNVVPMGQGFASMSGPSKEFEKLVLGKQLEHDGNPVLRWMAANVSIETDAAGNIKPTKEKSTGRIDGIVAAIMATGRAVATATTPWFYSTHKLEMA